MELSGTRVLITGASRGVGAALAQAFTVAGGDVVLVARSGAATEELARRLGGTAFIADLADQAQVDGLVERVEAGGGPIDVLVNNAAAATTGLVDDVDEEEIQRTVALNLVTPQRLCRQVLPGMIERERGHIVIVSSLAGLVNVPGAAVASATRAGLAHFTGGLRADLKGAPVSVTLVEAGPVCAGPDAARRLARFGLLPAVSPDALAHDVVRAVQAGRYHVRRPKRALGAYLAEDLPRRLVAGLLAGVRPRP